MIRYWMRAKGPIQENRMQSHLAALAFLTDAYLLGVVMEVQDDVKYEDLGVVASLNHTVHFHEPNAVRADQWMSSERESPWAGKDQGLAVHRIWSSDGVLLATSAQEVRYMLRTFPVISIAWHLRFLMSIKFLGAGSTESEVVIAGC